MPRCFRIFILIIRRLAIFITTKVLLFLLPLPFFPNVSIILAKFVGILTLALKQFKVSLPTPNFLSFIPLFMRKSDPAPQMKSVSTEPTISIGEKIRIWRQRYLVEARGTTASAEVVPSRKSRKNIEHIEFETSAKGINKTVGESTEALQQVYHLISEMALIVSKIHLPLAHDDVHTSSPEHDRHIKDEEYARLSAEKQVYEKSKAAQFNAPPTPPKDKSRPLTPLPKSPDDGETSPKSSSTVSTVFIGPSSGEVSHLIVLLWLKVFTVPAPSVPHPKHLANRWSGGLFDPYADLGDMNVNSPHAVKSKDEHKAFVKGRNVKEGMDGDKIAASAKWFQLPSFPSK
jgi:hypothetical protein